ncbi:NAD(P)-dependent oxidoreductase [Ligilactobacillus pobuzihii]|uniref:NADH-flavin reductase n=1 Tax=Ligilactobacillus pobuzihii TaxID=449659 RepID=A0A0R2LR00_9LACO|nr:NAD(P)H-binding protein [Ligilactobacillus pobuzihii]KRK10279.1 NADH-flavin reductase [Ligilactobacillus pobuzihii E100301 = KCTC 13174]KRO02048.1 NADH-flavin reductase [Ligilactobacillus pobuzihii]GEN48196.1 NADH-flavin reductase [Ligilactobacillus pobuzihii]
MTKVGIIGATGMAGSAAFKEAQSAGLDVTAIVRNKSKAKDKLGDSIQILEKDAFALSHDDLANFDVVVDAFSTDPAQAYLHVDLTAHLISLFRETQQPRFIFILGAGSLHTGDDNHLVVEDIKKVPGAESFINTPINQLAELHFLQDVTNVNWVGISPASSFVAGEASDNILYGTEELLTNKDGNSETTGGTMAKAIVKEIQEPSHKQERFTVANG